MALASRSFASPRLVAVAALVVALLALLAVGLLLAGPHLVSVAQPLACGIVPGSCYAPLG